MVLVMYVWMYACACVCLWVHERRYDRAWGRAQQARQCAQLNRFCDYRVLRLMQDDAKDEDVSHGMP